MSITGLRASAFGLALILAGSAAHADEPGPGGSRVPKPVTGEQVYVTVCAACHMADAKGATGAATIPALARNPVLSSSDYLLQIITTGRGAMPSFTDTLSPAQIAAVATYVRTHFGNDYREPVTASEVAKLVPPAR